MEQKIDRELAVERLLKLPGEISQHECKILDISLKLDDAKAALANKEVSLIQEGKIEGKNEQQRKACLASLTAEEREEVRYLERKLAEAKVQYNFKMNEFSAMKAIARLLSREVD